MRIEENPPVFGVLCFKEVQWCMSGEGNGTPLQYSCLENPMDGGAWWAAVHGVTQSRTRLKRLSSSSSSDVYQPQFLSASVTFLSFSIPSSFYPWRGPLIWSRKKGNSTEWCAIVMYGLDKNLLLINLSVDSPGRLLFEMPSQWQVMILELSH